MSEAVNLTYCPYGCNSSGITKKQEHKTTPIGFVRIAKFHAYLPTGKDQKRLTGADLLGEASITHFKFLHFR